MSILEESFRAKDREGRSERARPEIAGGQPAAAPVTHPQSDSGRDSEGWGRVEEALREELGRAKFQRWFGSVKFIDDDGSTIVLGVPNLFIQGWIERRYQDLICALCRDNIGTREILLRIDGELYRNFRRDESFFLDRHPTAQTEPSRAAEESNEKGTQEVASRVLPAPDPDPRTPGRAPVEGVTPDRPQGSQPTTSTVDGLKDDHTLDRFVVGACNHVAFNAGMDILRLPGESYNPLFVYGGSGQGKTHLLQGITRELFRRGLRSIRYVTCEGFVNRFVNALRNRNVDKFRERFQGLKVLVLDDVHILQNKPQTQLELLQTIDTSATAGGQVILASDSRPQAIQKLQKQLQARFVGGLVCRMDPPDYPTRLRILEQEAKSRGTVVPEAVFHFIAKDYYRNVRELIGALVRVVANSALLDEPLTEQNAARILDEQGVGQTTISLEGISGIAATRHGLQVSDLQSRSRARTVSLARQEAIYLSRVLTEHSLAELGRFFGGRNHATVNFAHRRVAERIREQIAYRREIEGLIAELRGG